MPSKIVLKQLYLNNWAQFRDTKISFAKGAKNVSYFIGKNGAGKTTLLNALYYSIFKIKKTHYKIEDILNKKAISDHEDPLKIELKLYFSVENEFNQRINYEISRIWVFSSKSTFDNVILKNNEEFIGRKIIGDSNELISEKDFQKRINHLIPTAVRDYYFLDGEQLKDLFDQSKLKSIKNLSLNLSDIQKVEALIKLLNKYGKYLNSEVKKGGKMGSDNGALINRINDLHEKEKKLRKTVEVKQEIIDQNEIDVEEIYKKIRRLLEKENKLKAYTSLIKKKETNLKKLDKMSNNLNNLLRKAYPLILLDQKGMLEWIKNDLIIRNKSGEIPAPIDASLILNILQRNCCICQRELDQDSIDYFEELQKNLPTASLNRAVRNFTNKLTRKIDSLPKLKDQIFTRQDEINNLNIEKNDIQDEIEDILSEIGKPGESSLDDIENHKKLQNEISDFKKEVGKLERDLEVLEKQKKKLQSRLKGQLTRFKKIGGELKEFLYSKNIDLIASLSILKTGLINKIRSHIQESTNEVFLKIIWDRENWTGIEIDKDWKVRTIDRDGVPYQNMSAGQNHVLGISFMSSLTAITKLKIPFIFDSPFGRISEDPIEKIGNFLPSLMRGSQIILFVTDTEDTNIYNHIKESIGKKYEILKLSANQSRINQLEA